MKHKVAIIGCGNVGMSYAFALLNQSTPVNELVLIDLDQKRLMGEVMDLNHGLAFAPKKMQITSGDYQDCQDADIVCICAGVHQKPGDTRLDLIGDNSRIFESIVTKVVQAGFDGIFLIATNPVDAMSYLTWKFSGFDPKKIIGSGTTLDTARLRYLVSEKLHINPKNVHAYVMGEHGDSEFVPWNSANIGLNQIRRYLNDDELNEICDEVREAAYQIVEAKGSTCYGIGMCLARITNAILRDENSILTVSSFDSNNQIFIGGPTILNQDGAISRVYVELTDLEEEKMQHSIDVMKQVLSDLGY